MDGLESNISTTMAASPPHPQLAQFSQDFKTPSGILSLIIAILGVIFNLMNITVLLHPKMRNPVNLLLTMAAICQMCLLIFYLPHVFIFNLVFPTEHPPFYTADQNKSQYYLFFADVSVFFHMASSWLIITTACFRFIYVQFPLKSATLCNYKMAVVAGLSTIMACLLIQIPNFMLNKVVAASCISSVHANNTICDGRAEIYTVHGGDASVSLSKINLVLQAVLGRFVPVVLLFIFTVFLVKVLRDAYKRRKRLHSEANMKTDSRKNEHSQTTKMLAAVVVMFFCVEFPHGILLGYVLVTEDWPLYSYLGELIDLATLLAFSLNLLLYSTMSRQYRNLFVEIFIKPLKQRIQMTMSKCGRSQGRTSHPYTVPINGEHVSVTMFTQVPHHDVINTEGKNEEEISLVAQKEDNFYSGETQNKE